MAPCPYVYEVVAKWGLEDSNFNRDALTAKWFDFYSTEMAPLIEVFDRLLNELTEHCTEQEKEIKEAFYKVLYMNVTLIWHTLMKNGILEEQIMNKT